MFHLDAELQSTDAEPKSTFLNRATAGRPAWYTAEGETVPPIVIGMAGGSASGKTRAAHNLVKQLDMPWTLLVSQDSFYKVLTPEQRELAAQDKCDFDSPNAIDFALLRQTIVDLKESRSVNIPTYDFSTHSRTSQVQYLYGANVVIVEGILIFTDPELRALLDLKVFIQCDSDVMLARRLLRDIRERNRPPEGVIRQYMQTVKPSYDDLVLPSSRYADVIVPGSENHTSILMITSHIKRQVEQRLSRFRHDLFRQDVLVRKSADFSSDDDHVHVLARSGRTEIQSVIQKLRDKSTCGDDFIFFINRIAMLLAESCFAFLPYESTTVPVARHGYESPCAGVRLALPHNKMSVVSVQRSGGPLERSFRKIFPTASSGSILIQTDTKTAEPLLHKVALHRRLHKRHNAHDEMIFLVDAQIGTGASLLMAIRVLLDHGILQEHIIVSTILASAGGTAAIRHAYPGIRFVIGVVDPGLEMIYVDLPDTAYASGLSKKKVFAVVPGMGNIGARYFGA